MSKTTLRLLAFGALFGLAACAQPYYYEPQYVAPVAPPLQPYYGPPVAWAQPAPVKRHYVRKRRYRVRCRCLPAAPATPAPTQ